MTERALAIDIAGAGIVSGLLRSPPGDTRAALVLAHGAGAGMTHPFMAAVADGLVARGIATLRFNFPFVETGSRRPDTAPVARRTVRTVVEAARSHLPDVPLFAGGKSFGGRMTSQAQAEEPLLDVCGLEFFGYPLHPAGKPTTDRADHLSDVALPMLFLSGDRDALAEAALIGDVVARLGPRATLVRVEHADHSFHVLRRSGRDDREVLSTMLDAAAAWIGDVIARR